MTSTRIIDKIKKCLALSASANEHEAAAAIRQAQKLMSQYGLTNIDIELADVSITNINYTTQKITRWHWWLIVTISSCFGTKAILSKGEHISFFGVNGSDELAGYAYQVIYRAILNARKRYVETALSKVRKRTNKIGRADAFCEGFVIGVEKVVHDFAVPIPKIITDYIDNKCNIEKSKATIRTKGAANASHDTAAGFNEGINQKLHVPLRGTSPQNLLEA